MRFRLPRLIWPLMALYFVASLTYYVANNAAFYDRTIHADRHIRDPFTVDPGSLSVMRMSQEALAAGLSRGDVMESINGQPYHGEAQWTLFDRRAHPGEMMRFGVRSQLGQHRKVMIELAPAPPPHLLPYQWVLFVGLQVVCSMICLLTGLWVVLAKPWDRNAWLILLLLTFPEVLFPMHRWWSGGLLLFQTVWFQTMQAIGPAVVLLIGIYFPERWRVDVRLPWLKWLLIVPQLAALCLRLFANYRDLYHPMASAWLQRILHYTDPTANVLALLCVFLYLAAIFNKLFAAPASDARRRLRVLASGSCVGLGALLLLVVLQSRPGMPPMIAPWLYLAIGALILTFPLSLAYVVVVQRALDVRILLRMGTKYVLARASLIMLELVLLSIVLWRIMAPLVAQESVKLRDLVVPLTIAAVLLAMVYFGISKRVARWIDRKFFREAYTAELVLSDLSEQARKLTETRSLIATVSQKISDVLHVPQIGVLLRGGPVFRMEQAIGLGLSSGLISLSEGSHTIRTVVLENGPTTIYREDKAGWFSTIPTDEQQALGSVNAEVLLPLAGREKLMGLMTLGPKLSDEPYSPSDLRLLQSVATQTGLALEASEMARTLAEEAASRERNLRELEIAREVQERLLPQFIPQLAGIGLAGICRPAQLVGGDYYDFFEVEDGRLGLAIGDVSGKGVSAALVMAGLRSAIRGMVMDGSQDLARLMSNLNRLIFESSTSTRYATFFFGMLSPLSHRFSYVNAGHNPPFVLRADGSLVRLETGGPVIGLLHQIPYETGSVDLIAGDLLITYTDGISEAMTASEEEWGEDRLIEVVRGARDLPASEIVSSIFQAADRFTQGAPQHDDMTLSVLKIEPARL